MHDTLQPCFRHGDRARTENPSNHPHRPSPSRTAPVLIQTRGVNVCTRSYGCVRYARRMCIRCIFALERLQVPRNCQLIGSQLALLEGDNGPDTRLLAHSRRYGVVARSNRGEEKRSESGARDDSHFHNRLAMNVAGHGVTHARFRELNTVDVAESNCYWDVPVEIDWTVLSFRSSCHHANTANPCLLFVSHPQRVPSMPLFGYAVVLYSSSIPLGSFSIWRVSQHHSLF